MGRTLVAVERKWVGDDFVQIKEHVDPTDEAADPVFGFQLNNQGAPLTRADLISIKDLIDEVLKSCPKKLISTMPGTGKIQRP